MITDKPICITGASGFIASYVICELLDNGYTVRGTVRGLTEGKNYEYLTSLPGAAERLELVQAELLTESSYDKAIAGCEHIIHTASPYVLNVMDPLRGSNLRLTYLYKLITMQNYVKTTENRLP